MTGRFCDAHVCRCCGERLTHAMEPKVYDCPIQGEEITCGPCLDNTFGGRCELCNGEGEN